MGFQAFATLGVLIYLIYKNHLRAGYFRMDYLKELVKLNMPLVFNSMAGIGIIYIDRIFIENFHGFETLGQYTYLYNSYLLYGLLIQAIVNDFIPKYYANKTREHTTLRKR